MYALLILIFCLFLHCVADFHLQGILCNMKQKSYWENECKRLLHKELKDTIYNLDYMSALIIHGFECSFITFLPLLYPLFFSLKSINVVTLCFIFAVIINTVFHVIIDNKKANKLNINLCDDQIAHLGCIMCTVSIIIGIYMCTNLTFLK